MKNYIIDLDLGKIENPVALGEELKAMTGLSIMDCSMAWLTKSSLQERRC